MTEILLNDNGGSPFFQFCKLEISKGKRDFVRCKYWTTVSRGCATISSYLSAWRSL